MITDIPDKKYCDVLNTVPGLKEAVKKYFPQEDEDSQLLLMEFVLHGLAEYSMLSKFKIENSLKFKDMLSSMFSMSKEEDDNELEGRDPDLY